MNESEIVYCAMVSESIVQAQEQLPWSRSSVGLWLMHNIHHWCRFKGVLAHQGHRKSASLG